MSDHRVFRPVILIFCFFTFLQFGTGAILYAWKIGFHPASTLEYYRGSETMRAIYPDRPDRFIQPRTFSGLVKSAVGHSIAYGLVCFFITHLLRSLASGTKHARLADRVSGFFFLAAFLDLTGGFLVLYGPAIAAWFRTGVFLLFEGMGVAVTAWLLLLVSSREPGSAR